MIPVSIPVHQRYPALGATSMNAMICLQGDCLCDDVKVEYNFMFSAPISRVSVGLFCSTPAVALARAVPRKVAMEMLFTGHPISAQGKYRF